MNIRILKKEDYQLFMNLHNMSISQEKFNELYDDIFKAAIIYVIELDNKLVGMAKLLIEQKFIHNLSKYGHIEDVYVDPDYRNNNYGKLLIKHMVDYCKERSFFKITLTCNEQVAPFYEKNGFEIYNLHMSQLL